MPAHIQEVGNIANIARLESFSNNWVDLPLIFTNADWARASSGEAAVYVDPEHPEQAAEGIDTMFSSPETQTALALAGTG